MGKTGKSQSGDIKWEKACTTMYQVLHSQGEHLKVGFPSSQYEQGNLIIYSNMSAQHDRPHHERVPVSSLCLPLTHEGDPRSCNKQHS